MFTHKCVNKLVPTSCIGIFLFIFAATVAEVSAQNVANQATEKSSKTDQDSLKQLLQKRRDALQQRLSAVQAAFNDDRVVFEAVLNAQNDLVQAELELCGSPTERIAWHQKLVELRKDMESRIAALKETGRRGGEDERYYGAVAARLEAEIALQREQMNVKSQSARGGRPANSD